MALLEQCEGKWAIFVPWDSKMGDEKLSKGVIVIRDNPLTDELRNRYTELISQVKAMDLKGRRKHYEELARLKKDILENKRKNYLECMKDIKQRLLYEHMSISRIIDEESEKCIEEITDVLTNGVKEEDL